MTRRACFTWSCAGVNITFELVELLELRAKRNAAGPVPAPCSPPGVAFVRALAAEDDAFERLYVAWQGGY
jgi:hypothetical protein